MFRCAVPVVFAVALLLIVPAVVAAHNATPVGNDSDLVAHARSGALRGISDGTVTEWRGVPYAAAPVGDLRWSAPEPGAPWEGVRDATGFAEQCLQLAGDPDGQELAGREDCLYLNVFAPAGTPPGATLPVMVHLHGGHNYYGKPYEHADAFVARGVIVVTIAYRLGVFGFMGHPAISAENGGTSGEYALLDQIAALEWVRDNIATFGGDPANVTLFGESAGSFDALALVASPLAQGLFARAALQSTTFDTLRGDPIAFEERRLPDGGAAEDFGLYITSVTGCPDGPETMACLRALPADEVVRAAGDGDLVPWVGGIVLPQPIPVLLAERDGTVPLLVGTNREEAAFFFPAVFDGSDYSEADWIRDTDAIVGAEHGAAARALYPPDLYGSHLWASVALYTDAIYTCSMRQVALAAHGPVWRFVYAHILENDPEYAGWRASHYLEEPLLWHDGSLLPAIDGTSYALTNSEEILSAIMTDYWTNFAKTGDPNGAGLPMWPAFTAADEAMLLIDDAVAASDTIHREECAFLDEINLAF